MSLPSLRPIRQALAGSLGRFPLVLLASLIATGAFVIANHSESGAIDDTCLRIGNSMFFAFPVLVAAAYAGELYPRLKWIAQGLALLAVWGHWQFLEPNNLHHLHKFLLVSMAALSLASAVPGLVADPKSNWWRVNIGALNALVLSFILTAVVFIGLTLAFVSIQALFKLDLENFFGDVAAVCGALIMPLAALSLLPPAKDEMDLSQPGHAVWARLCQWALVPIGFLFTAILAAYAVRILIERHLPDGMVALPVLTLGCYGLAALWILEPWRNEKAWAKAFSRIFPVAFPLFSILLILSLAQRIQEYGFTFDRYVALALSIWIILCCLVVLFRRSASPAFGAALFTAFALVAAFGPLSSREVCLRSQTRILEKLLANRSPENDQRICSALSYLTFHYDRSVVERFTGPLPIDKNVKSEKEIGDTAKKKLGIEHGDIIHPPR